MNEILDQIWFDKWLEDVEKLRVQEGEGWNLVPIGFVQTWTSAVMDMTAFYRENFNLDDQKATLAAKFYLQSFLDGMARGFQETERQKIQAISRKPYFVRVATYQIPRHLGKTYD